MTHQGVRNRIRFDVLRPPNHKWNPGAAIIIAVFAAAVDARRLVRPYLRRRVIFVSIVEHGAVVTRKHHDRVAGKLQAIQRVEHLADAPIEFENGIPARTHVALPRETRVRKTRDVDIVRREVEKERACLLAL